ncbi:tetratricopeptide repeat protein [Parabacteroides provencensis]|uniref:tetratricopeptide repeat protein n=1 Tax=Parabacteroides provencensis TaxID=1944636 RepID=UPI000C155D69|nr:tetratricopeptide repeat protein [Parabacteroides provencensis]
MKKKNICIIVICLLTSVAYADNKQAIEYYKAGVSTAKQMFEKTLKSDSPQEQAEAYYYLGEIAYNMKRKQEALADYQKGWECSQIYPYNKVGEGKILLSSDKNAAEKAFDTALKINKKDAAVYVAIASSYLVNNMKPDADKAIENVMKYNAKEPGIYLYEGDILFANKKFGDAAGKYEQAIYFDPECIEAYLKYADVYQFVNPALSIGMLQKLIEKRPDNLLAYRNLGNIYASQGSYTKAIEAYQKYISGNIYSVDDLIHYASALFFSGKFADAGKIVEKSLVSDPDNFLAKRLNIYNSYETKAYDKGLELAQSFFAIPNGKFIWQDYLYYGKLLKASGQYDKALEAMQKAIEQSTSHVEIYKEIADIYNSLGNAPQAIELYTDYMMAPNATVDVADYFQLGRYYYTAATNDSINRMAYIQKADSLFNIVTQKAPDSYLGNFWQARTNSLRDPETEQGLAKPYYESCLLKLEKNKQKYPDELIECYRYLGYYYFLQKDATNSKPYWNKILELDPTNTVAQEALKNIK